MSNPMTADATAGPINRAATFHPAASNDEIPAVEVAGVLVFVYLDAAGTLRVSLDFDTADADVFGVDDDGAARNVPVQVALSGQAVYRIDRNGNEWHGCGAEIDDAEEDEESAHVVQTACQRCGLDVEGWIGDDEWRDRGNDTCCPTGELHTIH